MVGMSDLVTIEAGGLGSVGARTQKNLPLFSHLCRDVSLQLINLFQWFDHFKMHAIF